MPTEAEWKKAGRNTESRRYRWGDTQPTEQRLNFANQIGDTQPVGTYLEGASPLWRTGHGRQCLGMGSGLVW